MTAAVWPYKQTSNSAKALANALGIKRIKRERSRFNPVGKTIINWGSSVAPDNMIEQANFINPPASVATAGNKLSFFRQVDDAGCGEWIVPWTTSDNQVREWLAKGERVVARTSLTGHSGQGIVILEGVGAEIVEAPLYTLYKGKTDEYRVHCVRKADGTVEVFDIQQKKRDKDVPNERVNWKVRNLAGGFIYARNNITQNDVVVEAATKVFGATSLDFGAVDVIYSSKAKKAYVLEVNTAPGLTGTTLDKYVEAIGSFI